MKKLIILVCLLISGCGPPGPEGTVIDKGTDSVFGITRYYLVIKSDKDGTTWRYYLPGEDYDNWEEGDLLYWK